jgi:putative addiction module CopG family antidote
MTVTMPAEFENLIRDKLRSGEYRSAEEVIAAAMRLFRQREEDQSVLRAVNGGAPLPSDGRFDDRLETLLEEAEESGEAAEMTPQDWDDIRREGLALIKSRKPA